MPRVYIGKLSHHVREKDIQRLFSNFGKLLHIDLKNGYGFVDFVDNQDAEDAVYKLNGKELYGERLVIEHARGPRSERHVYEGGYRGARDRGYSSRRRRDGGREKYGRPVRTEYRLIVENLSSRCSWQDLKDFMRQAGEVTFAQKERTNLGVIEFRTRHDMKRAKEKLDGTDIKGRKIRLVEDTSRRRRSPSRSRSRSRSRRRSHSRSRRKSRDSRSPAYSERRHERRAKSASKSPSPSEDHRPLKTPPPARSASPSHSKSPSSNRSASQD